MASRQWKTVWIFSSLMMTLSGSLKTEVHPEVFTRRLVFE